MPYALPPESDNFVMLFCAIELSKEDGTCSSEPLDNIHTFGCFCILPFREEEELNLFSEESFCKLSTLLPLELCILVVLLMPTLIPSIPCTLGVF